MLDLTLEQMISMTNQRRESFQIMVDHLKSCKEPLIIETGCLRPPHPQWGSLEVSFKDEGCSTYIFDRFINDHGGELHSIDINPDHVKYAQEHVSDLAQVHCSDSIEFLWSARKNLEEQDYFIDLLYLDSLDFDDQTYYTSPIHHLKELTAIISRMKSGSMLAVDDNYWDGGTLKGKGVFVIDFMKGIGIEPLHQGLQYIWRF